MKHILVVDDDKASCELLREIFAAQGWEAESALSPEAALALAARGRFDLVVSDINLEAAQSGLDILRQLRDTCPVVLITGFGTLDAAVEASREGAWDFISKPFKVAEVVATARRALESGLPSEGVNSDTEATPDKLSSRYERAGLLGRAPVMIDLYKEIARVAPSRSTVLVVGESGTGKELVARSIHKHSPRDTRTFIPVNCGAFAETLLESELFGYVRGAFTGATADRKGLWEEAEGGTLFLDEVGETSQAMQVKLLRALQEGEIRRVGAARAVIVDARVVAATNRDLEREVKAGRFREDLFYRLSVVTLRVPALRERRSDIPLLAERFLRAASENAGRGRLRLSEATLNRLVAYDWPGNVRELESAVEYAALHARGAEVAPEDLPPKLQTAEVRQAASRSPLAALYEDLPSLDELERRYLQHVLEATGGNRTRTAEILRIDRRTLYRMAERFQIKLDDEQ
ncbi:MAG: two-component system, NtrC family, response regulator AtoC [Acidobacteriota bacterium]|jgi:DNA-binding NtrC family response regulator|nr:two-component system, NtrC family, response regulator AtoC [Acidobacteriota bacterium]